MSEFLDLNGLDRYTSNLKQIFASGLVNEFTLSVSNWADLTQTITDPFFKSDTRYIYLIAPDYDSSDFYIRSNIRPKDVTADGSITFTCTKVPESDITINIACLEV